MPKALKLKLCADCGSKEYFIQAARLRLDKLICNGCGKIVGYANLKSGSTKKS